MLLSIVCQNWNITVNTKKEFNFELYLECIKSDDIRKTMSRFRLGSHNLEIESGRYNNVAREDRKCRLCSMNSIESEYHFLLCCPKFHDRRQQFIDNYYRSWPSIRKFELLMSSENRSKMTNVAKFLKNAFTLRNQFLNDV